MDCSPPGSSVQGDSPGKNTGVGCHALFQGIFPTPVLNPGLMHCRWVLYHLSHQGSPRILEWVAYPFCRGSSQPRDWTWVSNIAGKFFTSWVNREARHGSDLTDLTSCGMTGPEHKSPSLSPPPPCPHKVGRFTLISQCDCEGTWDNTSEPHKLYYRKRSVSITD